MKIVLILITISILMKVLEGATGYGMKSCKHWPYFSLPDCNTASGELYMDWYGLDDITIEGAKPNITVVGLYYADSQISLNNALLQEKLVSEVTSMFNNQNRRTNKVGDDSNTMDNSNIYISNVIINNYAPYSCSIKECPYWWWEVPWSGFNTIFTDSCFDYIGGCPKGTVK